jgi:hypothetical protein
MEKSSKPKSKKIYSAMINVMRDIESIGKDKVNTMQRFKFRGIDDVYNAIHSVMAKHGVFSVPEILDERSEERQTKSGGNLIYRILKIKYTFYAEDGSSVESVVIGEGMDSGDKASNKAMSVADKYCLLQAFKIPTEETNDPDAETPPKSEPNPKLKADAIKKLFAEFKKLETPSQAQKEFVAQAETKSIAQINTATINIIKLNGDKP